MQYDYIEKLDGRNADDAWNIPALKRRKPKVSLPILGPNSWTTPLLKDINHDSLNQTPNCNIPVKICLQASTNESQKTS